MERKLFTPLEIGPITLKHRVVMAPLTRNRSEQPGDVPGEMMLKYYTQRASDGGFIISEATPISISARGWHGAPGLYSDQQVEGWKIIVDAVHDRPQLQIAAAQRLVRGVLLSVVAHKAQYRGARIGLHRLEQNV